MRAAVPVLLVLLTLGGCLGAVEPAVEAPAEPGRARDTAPRNGFLLDAPMPMGSQVSSRGDAEPMILVDRAGGALLVGSAQGLTVSTDGGKTWVARPSPFAQHCDGFPLAQGEDGVLYTAMTCDTLQVAMSTNLGRSWKTTTLAVDGYPDRPWLAAQGKGEVTLLYHSFSSLTEVCWRSSDHARTFTERSVLPAPRAAGNVAVDDAGRLYYATRATRLQVVVPIEVEEPLLVRWSAPCRGEVETLRLPAGSRGPFDPVAVDPDGESVFVAQSPAGRIDLVGHRGMDAATQKVLRVSPPELVLNHYPAISLHGDEVALAWYATETEPTRPDPVFDTRDTTPWNVYVARIRGFWSDAPEVRLDRMTVEPNYYGRMGDRDLLDYLGLDHDADGNLHVAYGHWTSRDIAYRGVRYAYLEAEPAP